MSNSAPRCSCIICHKEYSSKGIYSHYKIAHTIEGKELHTKNARIQQPPRNEESRLKTSHSLMGNRNLPTKQKTICPISFCIMCSVLIKNSRRKTCSKKCYSHRMSQSLKESRRTSSRRFTKCEWYISHIAGRVYLESSWESIVARSLDENNINWIRPKYLKYTLDNKRHMYYPDFYLTDYGVYLDPKNKYQQIIDIPKLSAVRNEHNIKVFILNENELQWSTIHKLVSQDGFEPTLNRF